MPAPINRKIVDALQKAARIIALAVGVLCVLNLVGWVLDVPFLKSIIQGFATMSVPTASGLLLASVALFVTASSDSGRNAILLARGAGIIAFGLGVTALATYIIDFPYPGYLFGPHMGRVSPATATNLALLGAVLFDPVRRGRTIPVILATIGLVISLLALIGYLYGVEALYKVMPFSAMSLPTATCSALMFAATLLSRPQAGWVASLARDDAGGSAARRLLPAVILVPLLLSGGMVKTNDFGLVEPAFGFAILSVMSIVVLATLVCLVSKWLSRADAALTRTTRDLIERERNFHYVFEHSPLPHWVYDPVSLELLAVNNAMTEIYGYTREEFLAMRLSDLLPREDIGRLTEFIASVATYAQSKEWRHRAKDGRMMDIDIHSHSLTFDGRAARMVVAIDVTARKVAEDQLRHSQKMEAVGQLTGGLAHDFNNLLLVMMGNLGLLREFHGDDPDSDGLIQEALNAAQQGAELTRSLLAFARRQPLQPRSTNLNDVVSKTFALLGRTLGGQIAITLDLSSDLWPVTVDPAQLEAALANLATNARDAMPKGGRLTVTSANRQLDEEYASQQRDVTPGDYAMLAVTDSGTGISPETMAHIFEPFFTTKGQGEGTGLGLSMVFGFMKQSGGHINVYSEVGVGTTFRLYIPRDRTVASEQGTGRRRSSQSAPQGRGERVLVVEDSEPLRRLVMRQLAKLGYQVDEAENATDALRFLEEGVPFDLLFTDIVMAGPIDGFDLARIVIDRWPEIKVILTSGFPGTALAGRDITLPNVRLLGKPYPQHDLARTLREVLDERVDAG